jgi:histone-lysine N-methyltransferase SETD1
MASFAQFFPTAPRAAKDKAKEREKVKSQNLETLSIPPLADSQVVLPISRVEDAASHHPSESNIPVIDCAPPPAEDSESIQGDLLNGVGSASSHTSSSVSSVFSAPTQQPNMPTFGGAQNVSNLTPLTNTDSSPSRITSPNQYKSGAQVTISSGFSSDKTCPQNDDPQTPPAMAAQKPPDSRVYARDPNRGVKGTKCTYDPLLDRKLGSSDKKKAKPIYTEFGLVRIHNLLGSVILFVRMSG